MNEIKQYLNFKVGDLVRRTHDNYFPVKKGSIHKIIKMYNYGKSTLSDRLVIGIILEGINGEYDLVNFEKVQKLEKIKII